MEIIFIFFAVILGGPFVSVAIATFGDGQILERSVKVAKAELQNRKRTPIPGIVSPDIKALEPRNKDWGPDGKLAQMWQDAFDFWQLDDPAKAMEDWLHFKAVKDAEVAKFEAEQEALQAEYSDYSKYRMYSTASTIRARMRKHRADFEKNRAVANEFMSDDMRIMQRLTERYGNEVLYNNDMVRLSAKPQMPTFDYIALTSV